MPTLGNGIVIDETSWDSPNYTPTASVPATYGQARTITGITVHWWGDPANNPQFNDTASYLSRQGGNTSAHYVVEDGRVACIVSPAHAAWHAGAAAGNATTIGIECNPRMTDGDLETLAYLIAYLEDTYGELKVYGHRDWSSTACPGTYYDRLDSVIARVNEIHAGASPKVATATVQEAQQVASVSGSVQPFWEVESGDTLWKIARYYKGEASPETLASIAAENGISADTPLKIGQQIRIPAPLVWTVDPGDTWESVAGYYGYDADYLKSLNRGKDLSVGTVLNVYTG